MSLQVSVASPFVWEFIILNFLVTALVFAWAALRKGK
jgi:hypothetical protein